MNKRLTLEPGDRFVIYETLQNTDLTEGRGIMKTVSTWMVLEDAVEDAKGRGVMGVGDGDVEEVAFIRTNESKLLVKRERVYGYRKDPNGKWGSGYVDNREFLDDPDYAEYIRLKNKFEG